MNSHRLIYNANRRCMMAVADTARSAGKASGATHRKRCIDANASTTAIGTNVGGANVRINAKNDITITGSNVLADQDIALDAKNNVTIEAATNTQTSSYFSEMSRPSVHTTSPNHFKPRFKKTGLVFHPSTHALTVLSISRTVPTRPFFKHF